MPDVYALLVKYKNTLEKHFKDVQDIEFTIQENRLFILQTRNGKRTTQAAVKIAVDMVKERLIDKRLRFPVLIPMNLTSYYTQPSIPKQKRNYCSGASSLAGRGYGKGGFQR